MAKKTFSLSYTFETFENHMTFFKKPMFGGLAVYLHGRMMMVIMENPGDRSYRGKEYSYEVWNGVLLPMERSSHDSLQREFPELVPHPVLGKWLYLPMSAPAFELHIERIAQLIKLDDFRFGVYPKPRGKKKSSPQKRAKKKTQRKKALTKKITIEKAVLRAKLGKVKKSSGSKKQVRKKTKKRVVR